MPEPAQFLRRVAGKIAIVTGSGSRGAGVGTGKAIAVTLAAEGAKVCLVNREEQRAKETLVMIENRGGEAFVCAGDVTLAKDCERIVGTTMERYGRLDILVNNVGDGASPGAIDLFDEGAWDSSFDANVKSAALMSKFATRPMFVAKSGSIINVSSVAVVIAHGALAYGPAKAALNGLTREIAAMCGRSGIRANTIMPGHLATPMVGHATEAQRELRRRIAPLGVEGDAWDVAAVALFVASDEARFITGVCIPVDGGVTAVAPLLAYALASEDSRPH